MSDAVEHLYAELRRLDLLLHRQILRLRAAYNLSLDEFRGLYISDEQVDRLVEQPDGFAGVVLPADELLEHVEEMRRHNSAAAPADSPLRRVAEEFDLSEFEQDVVLLALAPEVEPRYETLYAYLNNDVTRKWPTCDLALRLFGTDPAERVMLRRHLLPDSTLFADGLLQPVQAAGERTSSLTSGFALAQAATHCLLGHAPPLPSSAATFVRHEAGAKTWDDVPLAAVRRASLRQVLNFFDPARLEGDAPLLVFEGRYGAGRLAAAAALCGELGLPLLRVDVEAARAASESLPGLMQSLALQQRLRRCGVYLDGADALFHEEGRASPEGRSALGLLASCRWPVFFACEPGAAWRELTKGRRALVFTFEAPDVAVRRELWEASLAREGRAASPDALATLAGRFDLTPGQIRDAVAAAADACRLAGTDGAELNPEALTAAARAQSDQGLGRLALKVTTRQTWDDLVLPPATLRQVKEVAAAVRHRHVVYDDWGFGRRVASGRGLKVLFAGTSGTGKTMTAGVIAGDLGLDLYKIDLSGVVSKYIGETEKNLDRIFRAARSGNAILFFDEADALFGKRSEVKDAHDRYANIEVAYLLQKMEEHEGAVILASNLSKNIDNAFARRMHYVVEFPVPDETYRERLWRGMFPAEAPLGPDVDFPFLAKQFSIAGGDIRNVALDAAFLAARDGHRITMKELVRATARQMMKQGKVPSVTDFKQYHALIAQDEPENGRR